MWGFAAFGACAQHSVSVRGPAVVTDATHRVRNNSHWLTDHLWYACTQQKQRPLQSEPYVSWPPLCAAASQQPWLSGPAAGATLVWAASEQPPSAAAAAASRAAAAPRRWMPTSCRCPGTRLGIPGGWRGVVRFVLARLRLVRVCNDIVADSDRRWVGGWVVPCRDEEAERRMTALTLRFRAADTAGYAVGSISTAAHRGGGRAVLPRPRPCPHAHITLDTYPVVPCLTALPPPLLCCLAALLPCCSDGAINRDELRSMLERVGDGADAVPMVCGGGVGAWGGPRCCPVM